MKYIEVTFRLNGLNPEMREVVEQVCSYELGEIGFESFMRSEDGERLMTYVADDKYDATALQTVITDLSGQYGHLPYEVSEVEDKNWNEEWEKHYFQPVEVIPGEVVVRASFHAPRPDIPVEIIIDPKMAFGTGNHATTAGMMQLIGSLELEGKQVIDMGCGSGILGIFAMKKGAYACTSIDVDPWSVDNALQNADVNGVFLDVRLGDASALKNCPKADLFMANINRNIILADMDSYLECIQPGGELLLSGFLKSDVDMVRKTLGQHGWGIVTAVNRGDDWIAFRCRRM